MSTVILIFRKTNPIFYSIERVFHTIFSAYIGNEKITKLYLPFQTSGMLSIFKNIRQLRLVKGDIYHVTGDVHYAVLGLPSDQTILTIHDCVFLYNYKGLKRIILKWLLLDLPVRHSRFITTISERTKLDIIKFTRCSPEKIFVIPNPVDSNIQFSAKAFDESCTSILFIGSTSNKNLINVASALSGVICKLTIVGTIPEREKLHLDHCKIHYVSEQSVSDSRLAQIYINSDLVLFPSTFEGFGLPIIEAQRAGRPVITSDLEPMKSVAGGAALLVDPFDVKSIRSGVVNLINNKVLRDELVNRGLQNAANYEPLKIANMYKELYSKISDKSS